MDLVEKICDNTKKKCRNRAEIFAIKNILYAKYANLLGLKGVKFNSILNAYGAMPVAHYCMNFVPSGGHKNMGIGILDTHVFAFVKKRLKDINMSVKDEFVENKVNRLGKCRNRDAMIAEIQDQAEECEQLMDYIADATPEAVYDNVELIDRLGKGYVSIKMTEFLQYFNTAVFDKTSNNNKFLNILYDAYDGQYSARKIRGKQRREVDQITTTAILMSDFSRLTNESSGSLNENFKQRLRDGYARRFFFYCDQKQNYLFDEKEEISNEVVVQAEHDLARLSLEVEKRYDSIRRGMEYEVAPTVIDMLIKWEKRIAVESNKRLYKNKNRELDTNNSILELYLANCKWLITKLSVIIHAFNDPTNPYVSEQAMFEAINFFWLSYDHLRNILFRKNSTIIDKFVDYFMNNVDKDITKTQLRAAGIINNKNTFKDNFDDLFPEINLELNKEGYDIKIYPASRRTQVIRCRRMNQIIPHNLSISFAKLKNMDETPTKFQYKEVTVDEFCEMVKGKYAFIAGEMRNGERKKANYAGLSNIIILDFDQIDSASEIMAMFDDYCYIVYTSKNHQKEKNGKVSDRIRLILFTDVLMPSDQDQYSRVMTNIIDTFGSDKACSDCSRLYWSNPNAEITLHNGKLFSWADFDRDIMQEYNAVKPMLVRTCRGGRTMADVLFSPEGDRRLRVDNIVTGRRNVELLRVALFLMHLVKEGELDHSAAIAKIEEVANSITSSTFKYWEKQRMINIVKNLSL